MDARSTITRIELRATSAYLIRGPAPLLVDSGMVGQQALLRFQLRRAGVDPKDLALVILTHAHADHAGGLAWLRASTDAAIACSEEASACLERGASACLKPRALAARALLPLLRKVATYPAIRCDVAIREPMTLAPYGIDGAIVPTPGHTRGCLSVVLGEDAIVGDLVSGRPGRSHTPSLPMMLEDREAWAASVREVLNRGVKRFHPAHGGPFDADRVAELL